MKKVTDSQSESGTILSIINNSGSSFGSHGAKNAPDAPDNEEFSFMWFGSFARITVIANRYPLTEFWYRHIFNTEWYTPWRRISSLNGTTLTIDTY